MVPVVEVAGDGLSVVESRPAGTAWHRARVSNRTTEVTNNLIKRVKRVAFGFRRFAHYRIRALLYTGKPDWDLLATVTPR
jgi:transposase